VAKGNPRRARGVAASEPLPLFPTDLPDKSQRRRNERAAAPNVVAMPRQTDPTPEDLARKAMARQPTGASGQKVKLRVTAESGTGRAADRTRDPHEEKSRSAGDRDLGGREGVNPGTFLGVSCRSQ
jgi:hypothetical protein